MLSSLGRSSFRLNRDHKVSVERPPSTAFFLLSELIALWFLWARLEFIYIVSRPGNHRA